MAKIFTGVVSSDKGDKTIVVTVLTRKTHPIYKKQYSVSKKFMAHDETNDAKTGDNVTIIETRPISRHKRFALVKVNERAVIRHTEEELSVKSQKTEDGKQKSTKPAVRGSEEPSVRRPEAAHGSKAGSQREVKL